MGYQESFLYIEPQWKFEKLIRTYEKAEQAGYYRVAGAEPRSVVVLKQPLGSIPAGKRLLWVCGDRGFHSVGGVFGGEWKSRARVRVIPVEEVLKPGDRRLEGIDLDSAAPSENAYMRRFDSNRRLWYGAHGDRAAYACGARSRERKLLHGSSLFHEIKIGNKTGAH